MLLLNDVRLKGVVVILILLSSAYWPTNMPFTLVVICYFGYIVTFRMSKMRIIQGVLLGLVISALHIERYKSANKEIYSLGHDITIKGEIQSLIAFKEPTSSILVQVKEINGKSRSNMRTHLLRLSIRDYKKKMLNRDDAVLFQQGDVWLFDIRLRPPIGRHNETGYKLENYALSKGIHAYGKIKNATLFEENKSYRSQWFLQVYEQTIEAQFQPLLLALSFGYKGNISADDWTVLRNSGLAHLLAISGLHIGFVYGLGWWLGKLGRYILQRRLTQWLPLFSGCALAIFYGWLAGFSLPTVRALIACLFVSSLLMTRTVWPKHQILLWCVLLCLVINPFSALSMSFWLSFTAVLTVLTTLHIYQIYIKNTESPRLTKILQILAVQFGLFVFLLPVQSYFFGGVSLLSPLINLIAVPWVSMVTVPITLFAVVVSFADSEWLKGLWQLSDLSLLPVWHLAESVEGSWISLSSNISLFIISLIIFLGLMVFFSFKIILPIFVLLMILMAVTKSKPEWQVDFLDVGHGLAILIESKDKTILYDTGMKWNNGSIAESVIEPILHKRGISTLDGLILSHSDGDHSGGKDYLLTHFSPRWVRRSEVDSKALPCVKGTEWKEGMMEFEVLWPPTLVKRAYNPHSCVVKLTVDKWVFLFTGDIDSISEMLILNQNEFNEVDVFLVPHHGSNSSSTERWVKEMGGKIAVVSSGLFTPWDLPSKKIKERHKVKNIDWLDTAQLGQIRITASDEKLLIKGYSTVNSHVWYRKLFGDNLNTE